MDIKSEEAIINEHLAKGNYHAAINLAISAMNQCRREDNQAGTDYFIKMIKGIANTIGEEFGSKS